MIDPRYKKSTNDHPLVLSVKDAIQYVVAANTKDEIGVANKYLDTAVKALETAAQTAPGQFTRADSVSIFHLIPEASERTRPDLQAYSERMCGVLANLTKAGVVSLTVTKKAMYPSGSRTFQDSVAEMFQRVNPSIKPLRKMRRAQAMLAH